MRELRRASEGVTSLGTGVRRANKPTSIFSKPKNLKLELAPQTECL
jgi:hypothetical protein